jgi:hypothetical protein
MTEPGNVTGDRKVWEDQDARQRFEHELIDRKSTWSLSSQAILFAAYGVTFQGGSDEPGLRDFREVVAGAGLAIALITLVGVSALIISKLVAWRDYREFFARLDGRTLPEPFSGERLQWGVRTVNTVVTLAPDVLFPVVFALAWSALLS